MTIATVLSKIRGPDLSWLSAPAWPPLQYFSIYRGALAALFIALVVWGAAPRPLGLFDIDLFRYTAIFYFAFSVVGVVASYWRWPSFRTQVMVQVLVDIVALTLLMHASGGVTSGFGMLLVVTVAGGSILSQGRIAILFAALATLAVLAQQIYVWLHNPYAVTNYPHAGMLGGTFFATAYLAYVSARRIRTSEALAAKREVDLANLAELNEHIIQRMQAGILALDAGRRIRLMNKSAQRLLGLTRRPDGEPLGAVSPPLEALLDTWSGDRTRSSYLMESRDVPIKVTASFAAIGREALEGVLVFLEDASAVTQRAQQLKLASLGRLAASIAHEIRNPLSAVSHANQLLGESRNLDRGDHRLTQIIGDNAERMNAIVDNVLLLSRRKPSSPESLELDPWLGEFVEDFVANSPASRESIHIEVSPSDLRVRVDRSQLHQVVWNLCENGLQHGGENPGLVLRAGISEETRRPFLEVRDNGQGIPESDLDQIFEPFFTTRNGGTGLGLYIARELCESNQASITHVPGAPGCCFRITFADPRRQGVLPA